MPHVEVVYLFRGVNSHHSRILDRFNSQKLKEPQVLYRVSASSEAALPSSAEMDMISRKCPNIFFSPSIKRGLVGSRKKVSLDQMMVGAGMSSIFYVDRGVPISYNGTRIIMGRYLAVRVVIHDKTVARCEPLSLQKMYSKKPKVAVA